MSPSKQFPNIKNVVFTGPAVDAQQKLILRADLIAQATALGWNVQKSVQGTTEMLVASRFDTVKAAKAKARGLIVVTYPEFLAGIGDVPASGAMPDRNVDRLPNRPAKKAPQVVEQLALFNNPVEFI